MGYIIAIAGYCQNLTRYAIRVKRMRKLCVHDFSLRAISDDELSKLLSKYH